MRAPLFIIGIVFLAVFFAFPALAQVPPDMPPAPNQAPVGGLALLALAGAGYAAYRLKTRRDTN
jgi:MYXO-CTERM domain-containing protein